MNSKNIGDIGEYAVISFLMKYGVSVYKSIGDNSPADIIIDINGELLKVQIKTSTYAGKGNSNINAVLFPMCTSQEHRGKGRHLYTKEEVDYFIFYSPIHDELLIYQNKGVEFSILLRFNKTRQTKNVKYAKDFLLSSFLEERGYEKLI